jgi:aldose 1-epimerase
VVRRPRRSGDHQRQGRALSRRDDLSVEYNAERLTIDSLEVVRLTDGGRHVEVSIAPSIGNIAYDLRVHGKPVLLLPPMPLSEWKAKPVQAGIPFLAPWANRIDGDVYWVNGKKYSLNPDLGNLRRDSNGLAIHGLLLFAPDWRVVRLYADEGLAEVTSRLNFWKHPPWMAQFPFAHTIEMTHKLAAGVLEISTAIENRSVEPMPLCIGFHPWCQVPDCARDQWRVHLPARKHYVLSSQLVPAGESEPVALPDPLPLAGRQFDDVFGDVISGEEFWVEGAGRKISVRFGVKFPVATIYAPPTRNVVCFEPMTAVTNAFNLAHAGAYQDLPTIPRGETWKESFWIRASGF